MATQGFQTAAITQQADTGNSSVLAGAAVGAAVLATAWLGIELSRQSGYVAAIWWPNAILVCALLRASRRAAVWMLAFSAVAYVAANQVTGNGFAQSIALSACNLLEVSILTFALTYSDRQPDLARPRTMAVFCVISVGVAPVVSGLAGAAALNWLVGAPYFAVFKVWYPADALGLLIIVPLLLSVRRHEFLQLFARGRVLRAVGLFCLVVATAILVFSQSGFPLLFLVSLPLVHMAFRLGMAGSAFSVLGVAIVALVATMQGSGPFAMIDGSHQERILMLQAFLAVTALTALPVAATFAELQRMSRDLRAAKERAEDSEAAQREVHRLLQTTLDSMDQGIFMADADGRLKVHNRRTLELLDLPEALLAGNPTAADILVFQERRGDFDTMNPGERYKLQPTADGGKVSIYERGGPNGSMLEVRTAPIPGGGVVRTYTDITARWAAEQRLAESEALYRLLAEHASDIIARVALDGTTRYVSPAIEAVLGFSANRFVGQPCGGDVHPDDAAGYSEALATVATGAADYAGCTYRSRHRDGRWIWLDTLFRLVRHGSTKGPQEIIACTRDVCERQAQAEQLEHARHVAELSAKEASAASTAKSEFLARMSHELRTPLNAVIGFAQMLQLNKPGNLSEAQLEYSGHIAKGGSHLLKLVNELLDLAGIESGRTKLSIEPVVVSSALESAAETMQQIAAGAGVALSVEGVADDLLAEADVQRLRQVLLNLLSNAIKYNRDGGRVSMGARQLESGSVRIHVTDTGCGIATEYQATIFEPFNRLGAEYSAVEGTGIGLSLSRKLAEAMNGHIGFSSRPGEGSTFWIELPAADAGAAPHAVQPDGSVSVPEMPARFKVLYVDDNPVNLMLVESLIDTVPEASLVTAPSGTLGLDMATNTAPNVIILDLHMPGMSGFDVLKRLKSDEATKDVPVIALTASAMPRDVSRGLEAGFFRYLTKPLDVKAFFEAIEDALEVRPDGNGSGSGGGDPTADRTRSRAN